MRRIFAALVIAVCVLATSFNVAAHEFKPGILALIERSPGRFAVVWTEPVDTRTAEGHIRVVYPPGCKLEAATLACGPDGLAGSIVFEGIARRAQIVVRVTWSDGRLFDTVATSERARVDLPGGSSDGSPSAARWVQIGIFHVLTGLDHVAFVVGLLLVVGARGRLIATVTAFTVAHSLTLALAATHVIELASAPVEAAIAASVVLVALEGTHQRPTLTRLYPWAVAGLFGLVHGLGFASALSEVGLPRVSSALALVAFNMGVELAQLAIIGACLLAARVVRLAPAREGLARTAVCYVLGALGAYWFFSRAAPMFSAS